MVDAKAKNQGHNFSKNCGRPIFHYFMRESVQDIAFLYVSSNNSMLIITQEKFLMII